MVIRYCIIGLNYGTVRYRYDTCIGSRYRYARRYRTVPYRTVKVKMSYIFKDYRTVTAKITGISWATAANAI
jgi:hypothetical protein